MTAAASRPGIRPARLGWLALDLALILVFALIGRHSHAEGIDLLGVLATGWPFLVACLLGWLLGGLWLAERRPYRVSPAGVIVWVVTVGLGMIIRVLSGDTAEVPFIIVATISLAVLLLGWRLITSLVLHGRQRLRA